VRTLDMISKNYDISYLIVYIYYLDKN